MVSITFRKKIVVGIIILFFGASFIPFISGISEAATLTFNSTDDAWLRHGIDEAQGWRSYMTIRNAGSGGIYQNDGLFKFDVFSIASDVTIVSATLNVYYYNYADSSPTGRDLNLYRATSDWDEDTVYWSNQPSYASQPTTSATVPSSYGWMSWDVTDDVQNFINGTLGNYGWKITDENYWGGASIPIIQFRTKENGSDVPYLEIKTPPTIVYVDDDYSSSTSGWGYNHFDKIQDGINAVEEGGMVHVNSGTYSEHVTISKTIDLIGENKDNTIIDGGGSGHVVHVSENWVNISAFKIQNSGSVWNNAGIYITSDCNNIYGNIISLNNNHGIWFYGSNTNTVSDNTVTQNGNEGMQLESSSGNTISDNTISSNGDGGIDIISSSDNNIISDNTISNNDYGIYIIGSSDGSVIYHNIFTGNTHNAYDECSNTWDDENEGNYWDDYTGTDSDCDGMGDTPYDVAGGSNQDMYPFIGQDAWGNNAPTADAGGSYYANVNNAITFDGSGSTDLDGTIAGYRWDWTNDGTYDTDWSTSATATHSYPNAGTYTVKLQVKDDDGVCDTGTTTAVISRDDVIPTADANGPYSGYVDYSISFDGSGSTGGSGGTIVSWYWTFGDGDVSSQQNPTHTYTTSGTYTVTLNVTNDYGKRDEDSTTATITELVNQYPPVADAGGPYLGVVSELITFDGSGSNDSDGSIVSYEWNFGDAVTGTGVSPTHIYTTAGNYTVTLTVTDNSSLTHSNITTADINVSGPPTIVIVVDASNIEPIEEENEKTIPITVYCYHQPVSNINLEILEQGNLTVTVMSPNISLNPGEHQDLLIKVKAPKLERPGKSEGKGNSQSTVKSTSETILLQAVGDDSMVSNIEQINIIVIEKDVATGTPGFELIFVITALALVLLLKKKKLKL